MDPIPQSGLVRAFNVGTQGSMQAAAAPYAALGNLGEVIAAVGEKGVALLNKHKELQIQREAADMELEFSQLQQDYELEVLKNPNMTPEQAIEGWSKRVQPLQAKYQREGMSPMEQDHLTARSKELAQRGGFAVAKSSMIAGIQNTKQSAINLITKGEQTGNDEMRQRGFAVLGQVMPEADIEAERIKSDGRVATSRVEAEINSDPVGMREKLADPNFLKNHPGVHIDDIPRLQDAARGAARQAIGDSVDSFGDDIATGKIKTGDDIDRLYGTRVPPRIVEKMKGELAQRFDDSEKARMKSPEYQAQAIGKASALMDGLATADDFEERYSTAAFLLDGLEDSPAKRLLTDRLRATKTGREAEIKTHADAAMKALDVFNKRELEKAGGTMKIPGAQEISLQQAISDGLLKDKDALTRIGIDPKIAEMIASKKSGAKNQYGQVVKDRPLSDKERIDMFQQEFGKVPLDKRNLDSIDPLKAEAIKALVDGKGMTTMVSYIPPEAQDAAIATRMRVEREAGERQIKLAEWLKLNPEAKPKEIDDKILEIGGEQLHRDLKSGIYERKGGTGTKAGAFIPGETSMNLPKNLSPYRADFVETGLTYGIDPRFLAAVSMHETASGKSSAFKNKNNAMGVSNSSGPIAFDDVGSSIKRMARLLGSTTSGPYKNARTIEEIAKIYAPVGAENDPGNLNKHWVAGVSKYFKELGGNPLAALK